MKRTSHLLRARVLLVGALVLVPCSVLAACSGSRVPVSPATARSAVEPTAAGPAQRPSVARAGDPHAATVRLLASPDFETRSHAARTLLDAGEDALPALGRAGDMPVRVDGGMQVSATSAVVRAVVATAPDDALLEHLGSPWSNVRREAAGELGRRDRWSAVPRLIDHLEDADPEVRAASAASLRRVTNNFFGYRAMASVPHRRARADRWRAWWSQEGRARARERRFGAKLDSASGG